MRHRLTAVWLTLVAVLVLSGPLQAVQPRYVYQNLGVPTGCNLCFAISLNNLGQVAAWWTLAASPNYDRAFLKNYRQPWQDLGTLGGNKASASAINNASQVVGRSEKSGNFKAFLKNPGAAMEDLGTLGGNTSLANAINDNGQVVGGADNAGGQWRAFLKNPGEAMEDLGTLGGSYSSANGINQAGQVVGLSHDASGVPHAFLKNPGQPMEDLGTLGMYQSGANGINSIGQVVGYTQNITPSKSLAFLKNPGQPMENLSTPAKYSDSWAQSINQQGQIVGKAYSSETGAIAVLWANGIFYDLNDLTVNLPPGTVLRNASSINDRGWIVGWDNNLNAYLLTPVGCVPGTLLLLMD